MFRNLVLFTVVLATSLAGSAAAEKANLSPERLTATATHVIVGQITAVYERAETIGDWKYKWFVAEIRVEESEKGDGIEADDLLYARYWRRSWVGNGRVPRSTAGHRGLPEPGESLRVYLARNAYDGFTYENKDGGFNVIGANGFEAITSESRR